MAGTLGAGGAEQQLHHQVRGCLGLGIRAAVLCLTRGERWEEPIRRLGVDVTWAGEKPGRAWRARRIAEEVRRHGAHVVQSVHFYTNLYAVVAGRTTGAVDVGALRGDLAAEVEAQGWLSGPSLRMPRWLAANSRAGMARAEAMGRERARTVHLPNVVDTEAFTPSAHGSTVPFRVPFRAPSTGPFTVLAAGRQVEVKRYDRFLEIVARLRERLGEGVRGVLVGDGPERESLVARAREMGFGGRRGPAPAAIEFRAATQDMESEYRQAHALVVTSEHEGTPNVALEAMACGLPVVALRVGGLPEIVSDGVTGFLVEPGDLSGAADALERLARDRDLGRRMGAAGRAFVVEHHSPARLSVALADLYRKALAAK